MGEYEDTIEDIERTLGSVPGFIKALPHDVVVHDWPLFEKFTFGESKIPAKYRELMGLAVASNIQCQYCQLFHMAAAQLFGATKDELDEIAQFASYMSAMTHRQHYYNNYPSENFGKEIEQIGQFLTKAAKK